ncbi:MAG: hypothetical protein ACI37S_08850 [Candidatus Gastranaerophilaceae bacterium]
MICPKCKKQIPKDTINCPHCNAKVGTICKTCGAYNLIYNKSCVECGAELVKFCPKCKSANFPHAQNCRKCGYSFRKGQSNNKKQPNMAPPKQFVLPELSKHKPTRKRPAELIEKTIKSMPKSPIINVNSAKQMIDGIPLLPEKELLDNNEQILSKRISTKKVSNSTKLTNNNNKQVVKKVKKKRMEPEEALKLQLQLNTLQNQLMGLQQQLKILPQQLNSMNLQNNAANPIENNSQVNKEEEPKKQPEIIEEKPKSNQRSVLPKPKKLDSSKNNLNNLNNKRRISKGILPLKANVLPNSSNVKPNHTKVTPPVKNVLSEAANKSFKNIHQNNENIVNEQSNVPNQNEMSYAPNLFTQQSAKNILVNTLLNTSVSIISLSGESGIGKNIVLRATIDELKENQFVWLIGKATPLSQITPCGLFQDILLTFFNVPNYCVNTQKLRKDSSKFFKKEFPNLDYDEIDDLINFLYPEKTSYYENLFHNKAKTFTMLRKVFDVITSRMQTVFVFDNFEHIDNMSYEFLKTLVHAQTGLLNTKFILTYNEPKSAKSYLYEKSLTDNSYADISLIPFNDSQTDTFINQYNPLFIGTSQNLRETIHKQTGGNPAYIEQILNLITDSSRNYISFSLPNSFEGVVKRRLEILKQENSHVYEMLIASAILGLKFYPVILNQLFKIDNKSFIAFFSSLLDLNYITPINESAYEFKNTRLWKTILDIARKDRNFMNINERLFVILSEFTLSSHSTLALIATSLKENLSALNIWTDVVKQTSAIGDENIYIMAQKYSLLLVEKLQGMNSSLIKNNIYERLGKIMSFTNPKAAIEYLPKVIENSRRLDDNLKEFELIGYLAHCCHEVGNHFGVIECIDNAVANIDSSYDLEIAMIKSRKLEPLLTIGNFGEVVDLIDNDILPVFEQNLDTTRPHKNIKKEDLFEAWLNTYLILANALVLQGDNRAIGIVSTIFEIVEKNHIHNDLYICKTKLTLALANTLKGDIRESEKILDETLKQYKNNDIMDAQAITIWNLASVLNSIFRNKLEGIQDELFQIVTFANNNHDVFTKNLLKLLLGKVLKEKGKFKQALLIYTEQLAYFANEKNSLGVLIAWYFISEVILLTAGAEKSLEYSLKALDIAQSPKIQNYYFIAQFNKIIGEAYLALQDYDAAKAYIESAIGIARQFDLLDVLSELYYLYGKYLQEIATIKSDSQQNYANSAFKMFDKAVNLSQKLENGLLVSTVMASITELRRFCQKNGIIIR